MLPTLLAALTLGGLATSDVERWEVHSELVLPRPLWLLEGDVHQVRVSEVALDLELACGATDSDKLVSCVISDVAIRGAAMPGDERFVKVALAQADERLTGAELELKVKDGRIRGVRMRITDPAVRVRRTTRARDENLRLLVSRALAGFDLQSHDLADEQAYGQRRTWLAQMPAGRGARSVAATVHEMHDEDDGWRIISNAPVTMAVDMLSSDGVPTIEDTFRGELRAEAHLSEQGELLSRRWALQVNPTAGSDLADGPAGLPYIHTGRLRRLGQEPAAIGTTRAVEPTRRQPSALQSQVSLGIPPGAWNR